MERKKKQEDEQRKKVSAGSGTIGGGRDGELGLNVEDEGVFWRRGRKLVLSAERSSGERNGKWGLKVEGLRCFLVYRRVERR